MFALVTDPTAFEGVRLEAAGAPEVGRHFTRRGHGFGAGDQGGAGRSATDALAPLLSLVLLGRVRSAVADSDSFRELGAGP